MAHRGHPGDVAVPVPYISKLGQRLQPGQTLIVHGRVNDDAVRFEVNLLRAAPSLEAGGECILHISVRFDEGKIVFNSYEGGWKKEERVSNPFHKGQEFDLRVRTHDDKFEISADQKRIHDFKYRINVEAVEYFSVAGDVSLTGVHWGGRYYTLPYETHFQGGCFSSGQRVYVYGKPTGNRFEFDLLGRNGNILFHYNPRFKEKQVIRNAEIGGSWGQEEREGPFLFQKNVGFDLVFFNEPYSIQIFLNGERIGTFAHRTANPNQDYYAFRIAGDLDLTGLEFSH